MNDTMALWALGTCGAVVLTGAVAWILGNARGRTRADAKVDDIQMRAIAAEARLEDSTRHSEAAKADFNSLREQLRQAQTASAVAETKLTDSEARLAENRSLLESAEKKLTDTFKSLAAEALAGNNRGFLTLAEERFKALKEEATTDLETRTKSIEELVRPLTVSLAAYQSETKELESKRLRELGSVGAQLQLVASTQASLQGETAKLVNALRSPRVRGRWGEIALKRTAELAGMSSHCDFVEQEVGGSNGERLRPDMIVKLPAGREVIVDSKVPLEAFLEALESKTDDSRDLALKRHAAQISQHVTKLAAKEYWDQFTGAPEFVVLFIPNDSFLAAAAEEDPSLIEGALAKKVIIATPSTFIALLRAIAYGWRQEQLAENAQRISALGQDLSDRIGTLVEHIGRVGSSLTKAVESYNAAVGSLESRVLPAARRFGTLGAGGRKEIDVLEPVDHLPRVLLPGAGDIEATSEQLGEMPTR